MPTTCATALAMPHVVCTLHLHAITGATPLTTPRHQLHPLHPEAQAEKKLIMSQRVFPKYTMHSSCHRTRREKLLIDMDRVRKSSANYTGEKGGVGEMRRDEKMRWKTERRTKTEVD